MSVIKQIIEGVFKSQKKYESKLPLEKVKPVSNRDTVKQEEEQRLEKEFLKLKEESSRKNELEKIVNQEESKWKTFEEEEHQLKKNMADQLGIANYKSHSVTNPGHEHESSNPAYHSNDHHGEGHQHYQSHNQKSNYQH